MEDTERHSDEKDFDLYSENDDVKVFTPYFKVSR